MAYFLLSDDGLLPGVDTVLKYDAKVGSQQFTRFVNFIDSYWKKKHTRTYFFASICVFTLYVMQAVLGKVLIKVIIKIQSCFGIVEQIKDRAHSNDFCKEILIKPLTDISQKATREHEELKAFDCEIFVKYLFEEEVTISNEYYLNLLT